MIFPLPTKHLLRGLLIGVSMTFLGSSLVGFLHTHTHTPIVEKVHAVPGELIITGTSTTLTGDVTAARLLDQANTDYFIDPAASGTSLTTAGKVAIATTSATENFTISGNIGFTGGGKIKDSAGQLQLQAGGTGTGSTGTGSIYFLDSSGATAGRFDSTAGSGTWPSGDGADGAITVSVNKNLNTDTLASGRSCADGGDAVNYSVTTSVAAAATSIPLSSTPSSGCLAAGDEVLIINLQGTSGDNANVGKYETKEISAISGATLTVKALTNAYDGTTQKIMVQRVPNYTNVTVNSGITLTANAWDGTKGGALFFRASGTVTVTGTIDMASKGFRGGTTSLTPENGTGRPAGVGGGNGGAGGVRNDSSCSTTAIGSNGANGAGGGGGGSCQSGTTPSGGSVGGGAGCAYYNTCTHASSSAGTGGGGGAGSFSSGGAGGAKPYNSLSNSTPTTFATIVMGGGAANGGGGGGGWGGAAGSAAGTGGGSSGGGGNPGGGIIIIKASAITSTGSITTVGGNGGSGGTGASDQGDSGGGGGGGFGANGAAGGSILIHAPTINLTASSVVATGGSGGSGGSGGTGGPGAGNPNYGPSGNGGSGSAGSTGGAGVTRIVYTTNNGSLTHSPTPTTSTTLDTNTPYGAFYLSTTNTSSQDLAEYYVSGDDSIEAGDVVTINENPKSQIPSSKGELFKAEKPYDPKLIGIISTNPGVLMGSVDGENKEDKRMLALAGRVPVKIDPDSPPIEIGDFLTSSDKPGLARKATRPGYVVARALQDWKPGGAGTIDAFIQLTYYMGDIDPWGNFRTLEVDTLKVNKTLEVGGVNVMNEINELKRRLEVLERK